MKRHFMILMTIVTSFSCIVVSTASAVPPGRSVKYDGGGAGPVIFDGKDHRIRGSSCIECHPDIFVMKGKIKITMADIYAGKYCGACHNGTGGFDAKKQDNCKQCHK